MIKIKFWTLILVTILTNITLSSCSDDGDDAGEKELDGTLYGEWVEDNSGNRYIFDYYYFSSNGTGTHGSYEADIDWVDEDEDFNWYTINDKFLYINGRKYEYWCDGTSLNINMNGRSKHYRVK